MVKIGQIGCGNWGKNITRDLLLLDCEVYVVDINPKARQQALEIGASSVFDSIEGLPICDGYIVAVCIPDLIKICIELLKFRKPIFSEKTLITKETDFEILKNLGGIEYIYSMHKWRYHPGIEALKQIADSGILGEIENIFTIRHNWVTDFHGGDVFWTQSVHDLTIIKHILGYVPYKIQSISTIKNEFGLDVSFTAILGDKPFITMSVSGIHCDKVSGLSITGNKGSASLYNSLDDHITVRTKENFEKIKIDTTYPLYLELQEFVNFLKGGKPPKCNLYEAKEMSDIIFKLKHAI